MSDAARGWLGTLAGAAAAGLWSVHSEVQNPARTLLAIAAGACLSVAFVTLIRATRSSRGGT